MRVTFALLVIMAAMISGCVMSAPSAESNIAVESNSSAVSPGSHLSPTEPGNQLSELSRSGSVPDVDMTTVLISNSDVLPGWWLSSESFEEFHGSIAGYVRYFYPFPRSDGSRSFQNQLFVYESERLAHDAFFEFRKRYKDVIAETKAIGTEAFSATEVYRDITRQFIAFRIANAVITMALKEAVLDLDSLAKRVERRISSAMDNSRVFRARLVSYPPNPIEFRQAEAEAEYRDDNGFLVRGKIPGIVTTTLSYENTKREYWVIYVDRGDPREIRLLGGSPRGTLGKDFFL